MVVEIAQATISASPGERLLGFRKILANVLGTAVLRHVQKGKNVPLIGERLFTF